MDENFIIAAFRALGEENVQNVKVSYINKATSFTLHTYFVDQRAFCSLIMFLCICCDLSKVLAMLDLMYMSKVVYYELFIIC